ncbi:MAG: hypothetical protein AB1553_03615 [Nitrospirota bacterium]
MDSSIELVRGEVRHKLKELYGDRLVQVVLFGSQAWGNTETLFPFGASFPTIRL